MIPAKQKIDVRRFKRVPFKRPIKFKVKGREVFSGHLAQDLSEGGVRFFSSEFIPVNTPVTIQLQLEEHGRVIELEGKVAWVRTDPVSERYQHGLQFADSIALNRGLIAAFVRSVEKEKM